MIRGEEEREQRKDASHLGTPFIPDVTPSGSKDTTPMGRSDDACLVEETSVTLSVSKTHIKLNATTPERDGIEFEGQFDKDQLVRCGFHERLDVEKMAALIREAMNGAKELSARIVIDSDSDNDTLTLTITHAYPGFEVPYSLSLSPKPREEPETEGMTELRRQNEEVTVENRRLNRRVNELLAQLHAMEYMIEESRRRLRESEEARITRRSEPQGHSAEPGASERKHNCCGHCCIIQ